MDNQIETQVVIYSQNGFEDDAKFVEVDGDKFEADETDETKPKLDDKGEKIPFKPASTDPPKDETPEEKVIRLAKEKDEGGGGKKTLEELAKDNPKLQKLLDDKAKRDKQDVKDKKKADEKKEEIAKKSGEWQNLAEERKADNIELQKKLDQKEDILGKYVTSTKAILKEVMATIPKENKGLIPSNFSPREQLEYITRNAKLLGAKVSGKGGGVGSNDEEPPATDEAKVAAEIAEIKKKAEDAKTELTPAEHTKIFDLSKKLKDLRAAKQG